METIKGSTAPPAAAAEAPHELVASAVARLTAEEKDRKAAIRHLKPLAKEEAFADLSKLETRLAKLDKALTPELRASCGLDGLVLELATYLQGIRERMRNELGRELKSACEAAGLGFHVVRREGNPEVRIAPLSVVIDFDKGRAELFFARESLATCAARSPDILAAREKVLKVLDRRFEPGEFFEQCWTAYRMTLVALGKGPGDRVELVDFLGNLATRVQSKKFHVDPTEKNYRSYSRAQFAFDVLRLRKAGVLVKDGRRINFGVATGTTASTKSRVLYMEDADGNGEYKLTVFFTEAA